MRVYFSKYSRGIPKPTSVCTTHKELGCDKTVSEAYTSKPADP